EPGPDRGLVDAENQQPTGAYQAGVDPRIGRIRPRGGVDRNVVGDGVGGDVGGASGCGKGKCPQCGRAAGGAAGHYAVLDEVPREGNVVTDLEGRLDARVRKLTS